MRKVHSITSVLILLMVAFASYLFEAQMSDSTARNLVTFFSIVFGFYMTSIAILYNAAFTKELYKQIDEKEQKRGIHVLKSYLLAGGYCSVFSISSIILFTTFATKNEEGILSTNLTPSSLPLIECSIDWNLMLSSGLLGIAALNIFFMILMLNTVIDSMIHEARK